MFTKIFKGQKVFGDEKTFKIDLMGFCVTVDHMLSSPAKGHRRSRWVFGPFWRKIAVSCCKVGRQVEGAGLGHRRTVATCQGRQATSLPGLALRPW